MLQAWWRKWQKTTRQVHPGKRRGSATVRPQAEVLEDRTLLSITLFKQINTTTQSFTYPFVNGSPVAINNTLFLAANDGTHGTELWKSDGTAAGTVMVND
jgi:hypothetical protein